MLTELKTLSQQTGFYCLASWALPGKPPLSLMKTDISQWLPDRPFVAETDCSLLVARCFFSSYSGPDFALLVPWEFIIPWLKQWQPQWPSLLQVTVPVIISISFISASSDGNAEKRDVNRDKVKLPLSFKNSEGQQDMLVIFDIFILKGQCLQRVAWTFV